jgi:hypothetical protein
MLEIPPRPQGEIRKLQRDLFYVTKTLRLAYVNL